MISGGFSYCFLLLAIKEAMRTLGQDDKRTISAKSDMQPLSLNSWTLYWGFSAVWLGILVLVLLPLDATLMGATFTKFSSTALGNAQVSSKWMSLETPSLSHTSLKILANTVIHPHNKSTALGALSLLLFKLWGWLCLFAGFLDS